MTIEKSEDLGQQFASNLQRMNAYELNDWISTLPLRSLTNLPPGLFLEGLTKVFSPDYLEDTDWYLGRLPQKLLLLAALDKKWTGEQRHLLLNRFAYNLEIKDTNEDITPEQMSQLLTLHQEAMTSTDGYIKAMLPLILESLQNLCNVESSHLITLDAYNCILTAAHHGTEPEKIDAIKAIGLLASGKARSVYSAKEQEPDSFNPNLPIAVVQVSDKSGFYAAAAELGEGKIALYLLENTRYGIFPVTSRSTAANNALGREFLNLVPQIITTEDIPNLSSILKVAARRPAPLAPKPSCGTRHPMLLRAPPDVAEHHP